MTEDSVIHERQLRLGYLEVVEEIIRASDRQEVCRKFLQTIAAMLYCPSALIAVNSNGTADSLSVAAFVGSEFTETQVQEVITISAISQEWHVRSTDFDITYSTNHDETSHSLSCFPIYKSIDTPLGFLAIPSELQFPFKMKDEILPSLVSLLAHRLSEFDLLADIGALEQSKRMEAIQRLGVRFPKQQDFFAKVMHDINGVLAVTSLQAQLLSDDDTPQDLRNRGVDRLIASVQKIQGLFEIQEQGTSVLLGSELVTPIQKCLNVSQRTFNVGMKKSPQVSIEYRCDEREIAVRGILMHWLFHNFLRQISVVAQSSDDVDQGILIEVGSSGDGSASAVLLEVSVKLSSLGKEIVAGAQGARGSNKYAISIFDHLVKLTEILGWTVGLDVRSEEIKISVSLPCVSVKK